ncbi:MAG: phosphoenolpyruvate--protein phosphotransferase [Subdoligranulum variabile]|uniref:phosphoenolpyruvate--protein phosphotransferase n=1 Tax=Gemmiger sp. TaxID=2049027 RepID=UPI002A82E542|nr:phosphoenolpyruvate--protein phosphotransferase [Gemmiger sp.]MCI6142899.1 phosphoenolpyruvate--protein phosphotransferase [Subdoligranulum variabile]MCI6384418.1 phosphoenolpyruvate--protein phosphotransferase [Subdoligranulum variabile]MDD6425068.1 phosphoenolpyruvate--protein phosphotransferase [Subdoligranulum variabile]MDD6609622.1 phosphoenolpyruvate--protein phosphotransferase [Subdoligranulum variabile]MDD6649422.1 phosphoenolpyruvate--protein phosphotransferase [Subdoligranulum var
MITIQGKGVSAGVGVGPLYYYRRATTEIKRYTVEDTGAEWHRFKGAQTGAVEQLGQLAEQARAEAGDEAAMLFETHQMMAEDLDYEEAIEDRITNQKMNAEAAVADTAEQFAEMFAAMDDSYMQARAADVKDVSQRILSILCGVVQGGIASDVPVLLAADDLAPSETIQLDKTKILGFITAGGSGSSHTAILARTMGIPAIVGVGDALKPEYEGRQAIADGSTGALVVDPDDDTRARLLKKREEQQRLQRLLETLKGQTNVTKDGKTIRIYCNIGSPEDVHAVQVNDGGGIGLFRSEFLYLNSSTFPTEDEQYAAYKQVLSDMDGKEVIIRTLDIGADKQIGYFDLPKEDNPAMGMRALRLCLTRPEIFRTQLRALFRASAYGKLGIMFPMVTSVWEVREAKKLCEEVKRDLKHEGIPYSEDVQIGIMIETPAAAVNSDRLAKEVDFFSIGTNDLTQYTLACDRQNNDLGRFYDPHHPAVLRLIKLVVDNAHKNGIWAGICGELGADLALTETFLAMGLDELSVTPRAVLPLRNAVRMTDTRESAERLLAELDADYTAR